MKQKENEESLNTEISSVETNENITENIKIKNEENIEEENIEEENIEENENKSDEILTKEIMEELNSKKNTNNTNNKDSINKNNEIKKENTNNNNTKSNKTNNIEEIKDIKDIKDIKKQEKEIKKIEKKINKKSSIFSMLFLTILLLILLFFTIFTFYNLLNQNIINGVSIRGINVSNQSKSDAKLTVETYINKNIPQEIKLKHGNYETSISLEQLNTNFNLSEASNKALLIGRENNPMINNLKVIHTYFNNVDIKPTITFDKTQLTKTLSELSANFEDKVEESSYFIEGNNLIITPGKKGVTVDVEKTLKLIEDTISNFETYKDSINLIVKEEMPQEINIEKIHNEIKKEPKDAYYTQNPFSIFPSENGVDFNMPLEEAQKIISVANQKEYKIPLKFTTPKITTNMIGSEAFPDLLSTYQTRYNAGNKNRTTNLILAANKINGTVLMPGETFSYNKVVGKRTIAAGYKEAPIYVSGKVVPGLGGGICQITSTLYNAVVLANLEITERTNHQFVPSYVTASRDATVVYGSLDFKFKNNRQYPIKINCTVGGGIASFNIFGLKQPDDFQVEIQSNITKKTPNAIYSQAQKILKKDGKIIKKELLSKDTYKRH